MHIRFRSTFFIPLSPLLHRPRPAAAAGQHSPPRIIKIRDAPPASILRQTRTGNISLFLPADPCKADPKQFHHDSPIPACRAIKLCPPHRNPDSCRPTSMQQIHLMCSHTDLYTGKPTTPDQSERRQPPLCPTPTPEQSASRDPPGRSLDSPSACLAPGSRNGVLSLPRRRTQRHMPRSLRRRRVGIGSVNLTALAHFRW